MCERAGAEGGFDHAAHPRFAADHREAVDQTEGDLARGDLVGDASIAGRVRAGALGLGVEERARLGRVARVEHERALRAARRERERAGGGGAEQPLLEQRQQRAGGRAERGQEDPGVRPQPGRDVALEAQLRRPGRLQGGEQPQIGIGLMGESRSGGERRRLLCAAGTHGCARVQRGRGGNGDRGVGGGAVRAARAAAA